MPLTDGRAWRRDVSEVDLTCYVDILDDHIQIRGCYLAGVVDEREVKRVIARFARKLVEGVTKGAISSYKLSNLPYARVKRGAVH
jgi:hypothetical protein